MTSFPCVLSARQPSTSPASSTSFSCMRASRSISHSFIALTISSRRSATPIPWRAERGLGSPSPNDQSSCVSSRAACPSHLLAPTRTFAPPSLDATRRRSDASRSVPAEMPSRTSTKRRTTAASRTAFATCASTATASRRRASSAPSPMGGDRPTAAGARAAPAEAAGAPSPPCVSCCSVSSRFACALPLLPIACPLWLRIPLRPWSSRRGQRSSIPPVSTTLKL
mmetsp:Transcript_1890/g.5904  ORF Transcript_1890/g.5904 Transcript_1890/m.5904 type:complete len:225 (-) Transcript_1890:265-939(-)